MKCDKQCFYRTPYGYCSLTKCQVNLGTPCAEPRHVKIDIKKYCIPKEEYNIPLVNEGIQEGRKLVYCKDCKYSTDTDDAYRLRVCRKMCGLSGFTDYDFCSKGVKKDDRSSDES